MSHAYWRRTLSAAMFAFGTGVIAAAPASAHPTFCASHEEYRSFPHISGRIYIAACAIPRRLCQGPLVQAARPREPTLVPRTTHVTAWMTPCDFEQGRGTSDLAEALHRFGSRAHH